MSSSRDRWKSPAWLYQSKADALYDLMGAGVPVTAEMVVNLGDAGTNAVVDVLNVKHETSGTAAAGFGVGLTFDLEDASGNEQEAASIDVAWTTATHGSEAADMIFSVAQTNGTVTELARLDAANDQLKVSGKIYATGALEVDGAAQFDGGVTLGDAYADSVIVKGRISTTSAAGAVIDLGAAATGEGMEMKYQITDWTNIPARDSNETAVAGYFRMESALDDATAHVKGLEGWAVSNEGIDAYQLTGVHGWAYAKGAGAATLTNAYGVVGEFSMDAGRTADLAITEAAGVLSRITAGDCNPETNVHGFVARFGDMDGDNETFGSGIRFLDGAEAGTCVLTDLIYCNLAATNFLKVAATGQAGVTITAAWNTIQDPADLAGTLTIDVNGTPYYVNLYTSQPTTV